MNLYIRIIISYNLSLCPSRKTSNNNIISIVMTGKSFITILYNYMVDIPILICSTAIDAPTQTQDICTGILSTYYTLSVI